jgi:NAD(P)H-hydrate epimerase
MSRDYPILDCNVIRRIDREAIENLGIPGLVLMENAGRGIAELICSRCDAGRILICCGTGNNGGDGLVAARHLDARGYSVSIVLACPGEQLRGDPLANYLWLLRSGVHFYDGAGGWPAELAAATDPFDWVVDAILGTGVRGAPRPPYAEWIGAMNRLVGQKLAVDIPSGLDADTGQPSASTFRADLTGTFVAAKPGLVVAGARPWVGQLAVLEIGVPSGLLRDHGVERRTRRSRG